MVLEQKKAVILSTHSIFFANGGDITPPPHVAAPVVNVFLIYVPRSLC